LIQKKSTHPYYIKCDLKTFDLSKLGTKFDIILVDPPWEEYSRRAPDKKREFWSFEEIGALKIEQLAESPSFIFLWCGSEEGLDYGRLLLKKWGFRRCEDLVWVKTNKAQQPTDATYNTDSRFIFNHTKEQCLKGIKGTVRRNQDGHIIHANVDTDIIIAEEPIEHGSVEKPEELYHIIEHFSLGRRRIELFGSDCNIRPGWVTLGPSLTTSNYTSEKYKPHFAEPNGNLLGTTAEIEELRPKSPTITKNLTGK